MTEPEQNFSRRDLRKKRKSNSILNILIGVVVLLIVIVSTTIFLKGGNNDEVADQNEAPPAKISEEEPDKKGAEGEAPNLQEDEPLHDNQQPDIDNDVESHVGEGAGIITYINSDDDVIAETLIDTSWEPIGTTQTGEHVSSYAKNTVDWAEKQQAIAYATNLPIDTMIFWRIKNGGSPQHSIGIVSSADKSEKYRVYLEWIDEQGWKPVKMDVLKTLDFDY